MWRTEASPPATTLWLDTGKIDVLQLIVAQNDLITGELSYLDSLLDYAVARVALERAVGRPLEEGPAQ